MYEHTHPAKIRIICKFLFAVVVFVDGGGMCLYVSLSFICLMSNSISFSNRIALKNGENIYLLRLDDMIRCVVDIFRIYFRTFHLDTISLRAYNSFIHVVLTYSLVRGACVCMHRLLFMRNANKNKKVTIGSFKLIQTLGAMAREKRKKEKSEHKEPHSSD